MPSHFSPEQADGPLDIGHGVDIAAHPFAAVGQPLIQLTDDAQDLPRGRAHEVRGGDETAGGSFLADLGRHRRR